MKKLDTHLELASNQQSPLTLLAVRRNMLSAIDHSTITFTGNVRRVTTGTDQGSDATVHRPLPLTLRIALRSPQPHGDTHAPCWALPRHQEACAGGGGSSTSVSTSPLRPRPDGNATYGSVVLPAEDSDNLDVERPR